MKRKIKSAEHEEHVIARTFVKRKRTFAVAESCTGGLVSSRITDVAGSSRYFKGGVVAYSNGVKISLLGVPAGTIKKYGAVSAQTAGAMACGVKKLLGADAAAAITGIAGPGGAVPGKPVGLAFLAFSDKKLTRTRKVIFKGNRETVKARFSQALLEFVIARIK